MFKGRHFDQSVILLCVRWYLAYNLSLRDLEEMMAERGLCVDHSTVHRWVIHFSPRLLERFAALCNENRRLAVPASADGGLTSGLQEDFLAHPTAAANKLLAVIDNAEYILAIELMAAAQAHDFLASRATRAIGTDAIYKAVRECIAHYADDRPLSDDIEKLQTLIRETVPPSFGHTQWKTNKRSAM
jgi:hypothetical protein